MEKAIINNFGTIPSYYHHTDSIYILLTSLNLGGAEKIVSDQLWANYNSRYPHKITLIVIYDKEKEHSIPPNVNVVRLHNKIENGFFLFQQIAYENKPIVCHLINDVHASYLFSFGLYLHIVIHNDKRGWANSSKILNHNQIISLVAVCDYVKKELQEVTNNNVYTFRHQINMQKHLFDKNAREKIRKLIGVNDSDILIGMTGRICLQKNYFLAIDVLKKLVEENPSYKLVIIGGFQDSLKHIYIKILNKINENNLQNNVILPGFQTNVTEWINAFDIGLNTSYYEGLSMATQEIVLNGLSFIASNVSGQSEIYDIKKQIDFFDFPKILQTTDTNDFSLINENNNNSSLYPEYLKLIDNVKNKIKNNLKPRIQLGDEEKKELNSIMYGSHNLWSLLNFIYPKKQNRIINEEIDNLSNVLFMSQDLNLGGAQKSLVNLLTFFAKNNIKPKLALINQSNQSMFYNEIINSGVDVFLAHESQLVFDIMPNILKYVQEKNIKKIVFWNVDSKIKLLIAKFMNIEIIDVSPGDNLFSEIEQRGSFQNAIYYSSDEYFNRINKYVSKFTPKEYKIKNLESKCSIIKNGVYLKNEIENKKIGEYFKIIVCGRIAPTKFIKEICQAIKNINNKNIKVDFWGSVETVYLDYYNEVRNEFKNLIDAGIINFLGNTELPEKTMMDYNMIITLGFHQGCPNTVLEACSVGLPVLTNKSGGTGEIINDDNGYILDERFTISDIIEKINYIYLNYDEAINKSKLAHLHVEKNFSMEKMADEYFKILKD